MRRNGRHREPTTASSWMNTLDAELREEDLEFRSLEDYLSKYRRVLDYFDATKIALTATPALHTAEIFGAPVYRYTYRQAVVDGYLIDHAPPRRIKTALAIAGIKYSEGDEVKIIYPRTGQIDLFKTPDKVTFEIQEFNKKVYSVEFNRVVAEASPGPALSKVPKPRPRSAGMSSKRTICPARARRPLSSASFVAMGISPVESKRTRQLFGSLREPSRAARALPEPFESP